MVYLLWGLLNIGLLIFFIVVCFRATKLIRKKIGIIAAIIFILGLLSFIGNPNNGDKKVNSNQTKTFVLHHEDSLIRNSTYLLNIDLGKTLISRYKLYIQYGKNKEGQTNIPISAYSYTTGFVSGTNWKPLSISVNQTNDNDKFEYQVDGVVKWSLLGITVYSEPKQWEGYAIIK